MNNNKNIIFFTLILICAFLAYDLLNNDKTKNGHTKFAFSDFLVQADSGKVTDVTIKGRDVYGHLQGGISFSTYAPEYPNLVEKLTQSGVKVEAEPNDSGAFWGILLSFGPIFLILFFMRQMMQGGGGGKAMGFGKSRARLMTEKSARVTFVDVAGVDEAREELEEIVDFLRFPAKYQKLGGKIPKGCLLIGPPGTGKTLLARAIAGEAKVPFFSISGSDFVEMFVGVGASRVRDMFEQGKKNAPCIIFIDEIDAVGRHRGIGHGGGHDEREQTLNQLLVEMDGFDDNEGVIILAATNRPDVLDPALLRPGRFDRQINVPSPDLNGREKILKVHLKKVQCGPDIDPLIIARGTPGFSGADLANLVNEAALQAARTDKKVVTMRELEHAKDKVMMGPERKSMIMTEEEKKLTAYHEGGHAIVSIHCPASDPIHKATIIPRGRALGLVMRLPENDRKSVSREKMLADLAVAMGGRVAEEMIFGYDKVTSGAASDIQQATKMARYMVKEWGLSDNVGPVFYGDDPQEQSMLGNIGKIADETAKLIDEEVKMFIDEAYKKATKILKDNSHQLHLLAKSLLDYETLSGDEIKALMAGEKIRQDNHIDNTTINKKSSLPDIDHEEPQGNA